MSRLSRSDLYSLHNILQSFCVYQNYNDKPEYLKERFELYRICINEKLYAATEHIYFDDLMFGNIVNTGAAVKDFTWTEKFIEEYKNAISPDNADVVVNYAYARLSFAKKDHEKALRYLNGIKIIKHIQYKLPVRDLTLMCYYELNMPSQSLYQIDSYRHFLTNNKGSLSDVRFERIINFLKFYTKLVKNKEKGNIKECIKLKEELDVANNVIEKDGLLKNKGVSIN